MAAVSQNISDILQGIDLQRPHLSTLAQKGSEELVQEFLTENIQLGSEGKDSAQSQLYIASFWGFVDVVKTLVDAGADLNYQNEKTRWTPLHAATFQEHGRVVMYMLERNADPNIQDVQGRTPVDFASASDIVWPFFNAIGCSRTSRGDLIQKGVLQAPVDYSSSMRPNDSSVKDSSAMREGTLILNFDGDNTKFEGDERNAYAASIDGDVLAGEKDNKSLVSSRSSEQAKEDKPSFNAWRN